VVFASPFDLAGDALGRFHLRVELGAEVIFAVDSLRRDRKRGLTSSGLVTQVRTT
jgi:hypothetical protein